MRPILSRNMRREIAARGGMRGGGLMRGGRGAGSCRRGLKKWGYIRDHGGLTKITTPDAHKFTGGIESMVTTTEVLKQKLSA